MKFKKIRKTHGPEVRHQQDDDDDEVGHEGLGEEAAEDVDEQGRDLFRGC